MDDIVEYQSATFDNCVIDKSQIYNIVPLDYYELIISISDYTLSRNTNEDEAFDEDFDTIKNNKL